MACSILLVSEGYVCLLPNGLGHDMYEYVNIKARRIGGGDQADG